MIGNGVGIAPMRAFCQESGFNILNKQDNPYGNIALFFGTRSKLDKLFDSDFVTSQKVGALHHYHIGYSREEGMDKKYVQDILPDKKEVIVDLLKNKNGVVFVCGSLALKRGVTMALEKIFKEAGDEEYVQKMIKEGRVAFECFGG